MLGQQWPCVGSAAAAALHLPPLMAGPELWPQRCSAEAHCRPQIGQQPQGLLAHRRPQSLAWRCLLATDAPEAALAGQPRFHVAVVPFPIDTMLQGCKNRSGNDLLLMWREQKQGGT